MTALRIFTKTQPFVSICDSTQGIVVTTVCCERNYSASVDNTIATSIGRGARLLLLLFIRLSRPHSPLLFVCCFCYHFSWCFALFSVLLSYLLLWHIQDTLKRMHSLVWLYRDSRASEFVSAFRSTSRSFQVARARYSTFIYFPRVIEDWHKKLNCFYHESLCGHRTMESIVFPRQ